MMREPELHAVNCYLDGGGPIHWFPPGFSGLRRRIPPIAQKRLCGVPLAAIPLVCEGRITPSEARVTRVWEVIERSGIISVRAIRAELGIAENTARRTIEILVSRGHVERVRPWNLGLYRTTPSAPPRWQDYIECREPSQAMALPA